MFKLNDIPSKRKKYVVSEEKEEFRLVEIFPLFGNDT